MIPLIGFTHPSSAAHRDNITGAPRLYSNLSEAGLYPFIPGLVAYWRFEDNASEALAAYDLSPLGTGITYADGKYRRALSLSGAGHLRRAYTAALNPANITVSAWVKFSSVGAYAGIACVWPSPGGNVNNAYNLNGGVSGKCEGVVCIGTTIKSATLTAAINSNTWRHLVMTHDQTTLTLYRDGNGEIVSTSAEGARNSPASEFTLGSIAGSTSRWSGQIDEVCIFNRAITPAEVLQLYNSGDGLFY